MDNNTVAGIVFNESVQLVNGPVGPSMTEQALWALIVALACIGLVTVADYAIRLVWRAWLAFQRPAGSTAAQGRRYA